jgi:hypothetical protein
MNVLESLQKAINHEANMTTKPKVKYVKVRIAVLVDQDGHWEAVGWDGATDSDLEATCFYTHDWGQLSMVSYVEAEVPVPGVLAEMTVSSCPSLVAVTVPTIKGSPR